MEIDRCCNDPVTHFRAPPPSLLHPYPPPSQPQDELSRDAGAVEEERRWLGGSSRVEVLSPFLP